MSILDFCTKNATARNALLTEISFVKEDGVYSYHTLPNYSKRKFAGLVIKALDPIHMFEWLTDHKSSDDFISIFAHAMITDLYDDFDRVMEQLQEQAIDWFADSIEELFQDDDL